MPPKDDAAADARKPKAAGFSAAPRAGGDLIAFTVEAGTGRIVKLEGVDAAGVRHELTEDERIRIGRKQAQAGLEHVIEQAFEAGIDCVLGEEADADESQEEAELSRVLLLSLIERSGVKRLMRGEILSPAIVATLIEQAGVARAKARSSAAH